MSEEKQNSAWMDMAMKMWGNVPVFAGQNKAMEPVIQLTKVQEHCLNMSKTWVDYLLKMGAARRNGDRKKVWETCIESNMEILNAYQESMKKRAKARHELFMTFIPAIRNPTGEGASKSADTSQ
jgi:hypothetical protein